MTDKTFILFYLSALAAAVLGVALFICRHRIARAWYALRVAASRNPYEPQAVLLRSRDGSITLARLKNGQLRSLKRKPRGKAVRKQWRRLKRRMRKDAANPAFAQLNHLTASK